MYDPDAIATLIVVCQKQTSFRLKNRDIKKYFFADVDNHLLSGSAFDPKQSRFAVGQPYILSGKIRKKYGEVQFNLSEFEEFDNDALNSLNMGRIVPVYKSFPGLSQKRLRSFINQALKLFDRELLN